MNNYTPLTYSSLGVAQQQPTTFLADLHNQFLHLIDQSESKKQFDCHQHFYARYLTGDFVGYLLPIYVKCK